MIYYYVYKKWSSHWFPGVGTQRWLDGIFDTEEEAVAYIVKQNTVYEYEIINHIYGRLPKII